MTEKERLKKVYNYLINKGIADTQEDIAKKLGLNKTYLSAMGKQYAINELFVKKLISLDENLNKDWILYEEGKMLLSDHLDTVCEEQPIYGKQIIKITLEEYEELKKQIFNLIETNRYLSETNRNLSEMGKKEDTADTA